MVKIQGTSDYDRLDRVVRDLVGKHELQLDVNGWTRKTYDVYRPAADKRDPRVLLARVESFATTNGEIVIFDADAVPFATALGEALEREFAIDEAVVVQRERPL